MSLCLACTTVATRMLICTRRAKELARRGSNEVVSCLLQYLQSLNCVTSLFLFSDSSVGQNHNSTVIQDLCTIVKLGFSKILNTYSQSGSFLFTTWQKFCQNGIKEKRVDRIYTPEHWIEVIWAAKELKPFTVMAVSQDSFYWFSHTSLHYLVAQIRCESVTPEYSDTRRAMWMRCV